MPCWLRGIERSPGCDAAGGPATSQANAGRRHCAVAARGDLDIGGWRPRRASDGDGLWRHRGAWPSYQFRLACAAVGDDVPAVWKHAYAAGGGQVAAQSTFGADEKKLISGEVYQGVGESDRWAAPIDFGPRTLGRMWGTRPIPPTDVMAGKIARVVRGIPHLAKNERDMGHPAASQDSAAPYGTLSCHGFCCRVERTTAHSEFCYASALHKSEGTSCQRALIKSFSWAM